MSAVGPENERGGRGAARTMLWSATNFATWAPRRRTHLLYALAAGLLALYSTVLYADLSNLGIWFVLISGLAVALVSVRPAVGGALSLLSFLAAHAMIRGEFPLPVIVGPWLCAAILLTRGFPRVAAYGLVALSTAVGFIPFASVNSNEYTALMIVYGPVLLVVAELVRRPRQQADAVADRYREDLERQRLLVVSELHDTVVRDLTRAVMTAEQARLARPGAALARDLSALTTSVRTAVEQLRGSLRAMSDAGGASGLDVLASSAPRPLAEVVDEARLILAGRGIALEAVGLEALDADAVPPGVRQQLARVLGELVSNMTKYAAPGSARILMETDGRSLEAMVSNAVAPERGGGRHHGPAGPGGGRRDGSTAGPGGGRAGRDVPWRGPEARDSAVFSSGLGLPGARRRVEALGGTFDVARTSERFTAVLSVPLQIR